MSPILDWFRSHPKIMTLMLVLAGWMILSILTAGVWSVYRGWQKRRESRGLVHESSSVELLRAKLQEENRRRADRWPTGQVIRGKEETEVTGGDLAGRQDDTQPSGWRHADLDEVERSLGLRKNGPEGERRIREN